MHFLRNRRIPSSHLLFHFRYQEPLLRRHLHCQTHLLLRFQYFLLRLWIHLPFLHLFLYPDSLLRLRIHQKASHSHMDLSALQKLPELAPPLSIIVAEMSTALSFFIIRFFLFMCILHVFYFLYLVIFPDISFCVLINPSARNKLKI